MRTRRKAARKPRHRSLPRRFIDENPRAITACQGLQALAPLFDAQEDLRKARSSRLLQQSLQQRHAADVEPTLVLAHAPASAARDDKKRHVGEALRLHFLAHSPASPRRISMPCANCGRTKPRHSSTALALPGRLTISVRLHIPATARLSMARGVTCIERLDDGSRRLGRHIALGKARAARRGDKRDAEIGAFLHLLRERLLIVGQNHTPCDTIAGLLQQMLRQVAALVLALAA